MIAGASALRLNSLVVRSTIAVLLAAGCLAATAPAVAARPPCPTRTERVAAGTWEARPVDGISGVRFTWRMAADETDPRLVVVADYDGILVTRDGGCTWTRSIEYADALTPFEGSAIDAVVAGGGADRSLHVLVAPWTAFVPNGPAKIFSSFDDGATWTVSDAPLTAGPAAFSALSLAASPDVPGRVYLLSNAAAGTVYVRDGEGEWQRQSVAACATGAACPARSLRALDGGSASEELWGSAFGATDSDEALAHSGDGGATWDYRSVPALAGGVSLMDVGPAAVVLVSDFWEYALSRDGGRSWAVGKYPKIGSSTSTSVDVFEIAHFSRGRAVAILPGNGPVSGWAGNVLAFDGRRWANAAPPAFAGHNRTDDDGDPLSFAALASTGGTLLALSSRGELMAFRR